MKNTSTPKYVLELDLPELFKTVSFVSESLVGDFGVQDLERQVLALSETTPLLKKLMGAIGEAQDRIEAVGVQLLQDDSDSALKEQYQRHIENLCCLQGSIATLMVVTRVLQKENAPKSPRTRTRKKKTP